MANQGNGAARWRALTAAQRGMAVAMLDEHASFLELAEACGVAVAVLYEAGLGEDDDNHPCIGEGCALCGEYPLPVRR